jgi:hypothetical protein
MGDAMTRQELNLIEYIFKAPGNRKIGALRVRDDIPKLIAEIKRLRDDGVEIKCPRCQALAQEVEK